MVAIEIPYVSAGPGHPATLVRGVDEYNHWDPDPHPTKDKMPELIEMMLEHNAQYTNPKFRQSA